MSPAIPILSGVRRSCKYADACTELIHAIRDQCFIEASHVGVLIEAESSLEDRKRLLVGLYFAGLVSPEIAETGAGMVRPDGGLR